MDDLDVALDDQLVEPAVGSSAERSNRPLLVTVVMVWAVVAVVVLGVAWLTIGTGRVQGSSMEPTLSTGDTIVMSRHSTPSVGDIVNADVPVVDGRRRQIVKRVVAVGGDVVEYDDCRLRRNGEPVDEPYLDPAASARVCGPSLPPTVVPAGHVWLMGDNRSESVDSRSFGAVDRSDLRGVMLFSF